MSTYGYINKESKVPQHFQIQDLTVFAETMVSSIFNSKHKSNSALDTSKEGSFDMLLDL